MVNVDWNEVQRTYEISQAASRNLSEALRDLIDSRGAGDLGEIARLQGVKIEAERVFMETAGPILHRGSE